MAVPVVVVAEVGVSVALPVDTQADATLTLLSVASGDIDETSFARWIRANGNKKPVVGFIAGQTAPKGRKMGHAGAIVGGADDTAAAKMAILAENGIHVVDSPAQIGAVMARVMRG